MDAVVVDRALQYLENTIRHEEWPWYFSEEARRETRAFALSVLGRWERLEASLLKPSLDELELQSVFAKHSPRLAASLASGSTLFELYITGDLIQVI